MPKPPDFSQLRAFVFCREVVFTDDGTNLIHIHDQRFSPSFPTQFEELFLYVSFATEEAGPHHLQLCWRLDNGPVEVLSERAQRVDDTRLVHMRIPCDWEFPGPGLYSFALFCEGALMGTTSLEILWMSKGASA